MARKAKIAKEKQRVRMVERYQERRNKLRKLARNINDPDISYDDFLAAMYKLQQQPRNANPTRLRQRCFLCGRSRGVYRLFGLCRSHLRWAAMLGYIPGLRKASW